ncbi:MAG TPA: UvrD-helicase domain-containing protein [Ottowia sp.]|uniref:UvrD-helicase domain-containing protein n=1 Tax=Ottowia sp. TaxID=1898956 RepID=UPI002C2DD172|nr:UvrD-helicase domain-containing protein [Ottowia sp.]HMN22725.1 UvrD-helicase domain-containing protein [Ottowia sp.]
MNPAYKHNGQPCTREQFYAIACDPRRSVAVEACAGAGKTWVLVSRILRALLDGAAPHEILAITFTRKAAGEMRQRLQEWLLDFARPAAGEGEAEWAERLAGELRLRGVAPAQAAQQVESLKGLYARLLDAARPVQIRTFHGWFGALLKSAPLALLQDLGLPAAYELLEDDSDAVAQVWRPFLRHVDGDAVLRADYLALVATMGRFRAQQALEAALARRVEFELADEAGRVDGAVATFGECFLRLASVEHPTDWLLVRPAGRELLEQAARALAPLARTFAAKGAELEAAVAAGDWQGVTAALFTSGGEGTPRAFGKSRPEVVSAAQDEVDAIRQALHQHEAHLHQQRMARLTRALIDCFARLKRERGWVDMNDIERAARALLDDHELSAWVQEQLDLRVRHLLIDEFQDTNPLQWQAMHAWLSGYAGAGGGPEVPSVFIVGDPKQSIYRFRRADPRVFAAAQAFVVQALDGELLATDHTRRNAPGVLAGVNAVLQQAQDTGEFEGFRTHSTESGQPGHIEALPLIPRPDKAPAEAPDAGWRDSLTQPRVEPEERLRSLECRQAARWIAGRLAAGVPPRELMVLARKREPLAELQVALRALGIACEQPDKSRLADQPAVLDLLALVDALVSPGNDLALARALRSPLFGLGDDDLACIARTVQAAAPEPPPWLDALAQAPLAGRDGAALHAELMQCRDWLLHLPPHDALQAIYARHDVLARFAAAAPAPERQHVLAQLRALLAAALEVQGGRLLTAYQWLRVLRRRSPAVPRHAAPEAMQLLTVHGAKGLEADEVLLLDACAGAPGHRGEPALLLDWPGDARAPSRLVFLASASRPPPCAVELAEQEATAQAREELNALYVAMTRARRRLVLSGVTPYREVEGSWWQRVQPLAADLPEPPQPPAPAPSASEPDAFRLPELPPLPESARPAAAPEPEPAERSDAARIGEAMHWLLEHAGETPDGWRQARVAQAARRFALDDAQVAHAEAMAHRILTGEAAWAWSPDEVLEAFNEVELVHDGQRLRIDRLVRRRASGDEPEAWWVLDYKSAAHPERDEALRAQLDRYRAAVQRLHPRAVVRVGFLSGEGRVTV